MNMSELVDVTKVVETLSKQGINDAETLGRCVGVGTADVKLMLGAMEESNGRFALNDAEAKTIRDRLVRIAAVGMDENLAAKVGLRFMENETVKADTRFKAKHGMIGNNTNILILNESLRKAKELAAQHE